MMEAAAMIATSQHAHRLGQIDEMHQMRLKLIDLQSDISVMRSEMQSRFRAMEAEKERRRDAWRFWVVRICPVVIGSCMGFVAGAILK